MRDLLLGRVPRDADFVFTVSEREFIQRNPAARKIENASLPLFLLEGQEYSPLVEGCFATDAMRRDFTLNALFLSQEGVLHLHPQALGDLRARVIRPASSSSLENDPVRVFRAARFTALLPDFCLHTETVAQMRALSCGVRLADIPAEQVGKEIRKACLTARPGNFLRALGQGLCMSPWFQEFVKAGNRPADPSCFHDASVLEHTARNMDVVASLADSMPPRTERAGRERTRALAVWMALCHDIGKTATPAEELPKHYGHDKRGEPLARALAVRLRLPRLFEKAGGLSARLHMTAARYTILRPGTKVDLLMTLHNAHLVLPFFLAVTADTGQRGLLLRVFRDYERILSVSLPAGQRNRGVVSGIRLRDLRCVALAEA